MKVKFIIGFFGLTEMLIGAITLLAVTISLIQKTSTKPLAVLIFVLTTSIISLFLGMGILRRSLESYHLLIFFAIVIIFSKVLIFAKIMSLNGALETAIPADIKNLISIVYHLSLVYLLSIPEVKKEFGERRNVLFSIKIPFRK